MSSLFRSIVHLLPLLISLAATAPSACPSPSTAPNTPSPTYTNGTANPFYPCGSTFAEIQACPYRCYSVNGTLGDQCYTQQAASVAITSLQNICVQCVIPDQPEDYPTGCQPLSTYFNTTSPSTPIPAACGFANHRIQSCAWYCAAAQVPFTMCSATDTSSTYSVCERCTPLCSSPRIVFDPPYLPSNFSISDGDCGERYGRQQVVACPWRCGVAGRQTEGGRRVEFCSLWDRTDGWFMSCRACGRVR